MSYQFEFIHPTPLPEYCVRRAVNFIRELDRLAAIFQPENSEPPSLGFDSLFHGEADVDRGHAILADLRRQFSTPGFRKTQQTATNYFLCILLIAFHNVAHALQSDTAEESSSYMEDARYMLGYLDCLILSAEDRWDLSEFARKGAAVTNSIYNYSKERVFAWCNVNRSRYGSTQAAAIEVVAIERLGVVTARKYIKEWEATHGSLLKNQSSAGECLSVSLF